MTTLTQPNTTNTAQEADEVLKSLTDKRILSAKSHYPLEPVKIYQDALYAFDTCLHERGLCYTVLSSYLGSSCGHVIILVAVRKEDLNRLSEIIKVFSADKEET